jgi:hypothetical protein
LYSFFVTAAVKIPCFINTYVHVSNLTYNVHSVGTVDRRPEGFGRETVDLVSPTFENKERREGKGSSPLSSRAAAAAAAAAEQQIPIPSRYS